MPRILFVIGSLREKSFNRQLAREVERIVAGRAEVSYLDYAGIPFMNQDVEFPAPDSIVRVREEVQSADALWIFTAEYNYQIPGMLKNLLDWLSRPLVKNDWGSGSAAGGKVVTIAGVGGKNATAGVRKSLAALLAAMNMQVIAGEGTGVAVNAKAWATDVANFSDDTLAAVSRQVEELLAALVS